MTDKRKQIAFTVAVLVWLIMGFFLMTHGEYRNPETGASCRPYHNDPRDGDSLGQDEIAPCELVTR